MAKLPTISVSELQKLSEGIVLVTPSRLEGINFLKKYNAWGYLRIKKRPDYLAIYVSRPESKIMYFGKVKKVIYANKVDNIPVASKDIDKKLILLCDDSLRRLEKVIPLGKCPWKAQSTKRVRLSRFIKANSLDDL